MLMSVCVRGRGGDGGAEERAAQLQGELNEWVGMDGWMDMGICCDVCVCCMGWVDRCSPFSSSVHLWSQAPPYPPPTLISIYSHTHTRNRKQTLVHLPMIHDTRLENNHTHPNNTWRKAPLQH